MLVLGARAAEAAPKLYIQIAGVKVTSKSKCKLIPYAKAQLTERFKASKHVTLDIGKPVPKGKALAKLLAKKRLKGYRVLLRITKCAATVHPPPKGKVYRVLMAAVSVAVHAELLPSDQMALAGQGSSQVGTEISKVKEKEKQQLLREALAAATKQAVDKSIGSLAKRKRRRRRR